MKFPTTSEELQIVFERIGIGSKDDFGNPYEEWFISDYDCYVDGLYEKLGEYENLDELNYLASKLDELDDHDYNHLQAAMQISDYTGSIKDVINLIDNLDKYEIYPGVESNADLGHYYIEELGMMEVLDYLDDYIDYESYGRDVAINEIIAICRMILTAIWHILSDLKPYTPEGFLESRPVKEEKVLSTSQALNLLKQRGYIIKDKPLAVF